MLIKIFMKFYKKKIEHFKRIATKTDELKAQKYALKKICEKNNYIWKEFPDDEFAYDCLHSETSCLKESVYPTIIKKTSASLPIQPTTPIPIESTPSPIQIISPPPPQYYEWRKRNTDDYNEAVRLNSTTSILSSQFESSNNRTSEINSKRDAQNTINNFEKNLNKNKDKIKESIKENVPITITINKKRPKAGALFGLIKNWKKSTQELKNEMRSGWESESDRKKREEWQKKA
jgi:hypothetical protein